MAIPVHTDHYLAQVIFKGKSGLPADVYVNTFFFRNDDVISDAEEVADRLADHLLEFYNVAPTGGSGTPHAVGLLMSSATIENDFEVKVYDLGLPAPRNPLSRIRTMSTLHGTALPSECAVCLSYVATANQPRNRGRIYIGPLASTVGDLEGGRMIVSAGAQEMILLSAERLANKSEHTWSLYSRADNAMKPLTGAWCDNAFDTQRRRGEEATERHHIGTYAGQAGTAVPGAAGWSN